VPQLQVALAHSASLPARYIDPRLLTAEGTEEVLQKNYLDGQIPQGLEEGW
jgi:hypothetical protein